ncbi:MAG: EamA family transporter [Patescibacteria group bacterium]|nr:EamA family transporter [Patescibacteria group bacterium]MDD5121710.1 EamA family transporter [Patescibacteria group bacterium]MDD5221705.1 EamA family transporter [Patescibacteria group bacterium]MDD5396126.1 EamA family transporter [Patescibacteria group bacterium]
MVMALVFAILAPCIWAFMNVLDKYVIVHKVQKPLSFAAVAGLANLTIGVVLAIFLNWSDIQLKDTVFSVISGILFGAQFFFYYLILQKEDVSHFVGLLYIYPIIIAILSFLLLHERLSLFSYLGMIITLSGIVILSVRVSQLKWQTGIWMLISMIVVVSLYEFNIKVSTEKLPELNGVSITGIFAGLTALTILFKNENRRWFWSELKNIKWAYLIETFTFLGILTTYLAMSGLSATIVSSMASIQPLAVLLFESAMERKFGKMTRDKSFRHKLLPLSLVVVGIFLLYLPEALKR